MVLPWPPRECSPNARCHYQTKAKAARRYRHDCWALACVAKLRVDWAGPVRLRITFCPPSRRRMDLDNAVAWIKNGLDGLADALKVDDSRFFLQPAFGEPVPGGRVEIRIAP